MGASIWVWFQANTYAIIGALFAVYIIQGNKLPSIQSWQAFLDSFETKGGQLMLLWVTDFIFLAILVHYWQIFDAHVQTIIVGLLSGVNGAFLGAIGARNTSNGNPPPNLPNVPDKLTVGLTPENGVTK
jgi:hypothetical protein